MNAVAERVLVYCDEGGQEHSFLIRIGQPVADGECWACDYEIGAPSSFAATAYGEDSLQALVMALHAVQAHLQAPDLRRNHRGLSTTFPPLQVTNSIAPTPDRCT
jgi:hypothetical protein